MRPNPQFPTDLVTFTQKTLNGILHFLSSVESVRKVITQNDDEF